MMHRLNSLWKSTTILSAFKMKLWIKEKRKRLKKMKKKGQESRNLGSCLCWLQRKIQRESLRLVANLLKASIKKKDPTLSSFRWQEKEKKVLKMNKEVKQLKAQHKKSWGKGFSWDSLLLKRNLSHAVKLWILSLFNLKVGDLMGYVKIIRTTFYFRIGCNDEFKIFHVFVHLWTTCNN